MQDSLTTIPHNSNMSGSNRDNHVPRSSDQNRIDTIAITSEPGREGEGRTYVPPSTLHPDQSSMTDGTASGTYRRDPDLNMDRDREEESMRSQPVMTRSDRMPQTSSQPQHGLDFGKMWRSLSDNVRERTMQMRDTVKHRPLVSMLAMMGVGMVLRRFMQRR